MRGIGVLRERLESRRLFMLMDRSRGALVCNVPIDQYAWRNCTSNKYVVFAADAAALVNRKM